MAEGTAINDLFKSDRVLIGGEDTENGKKAIESLLEIYNKWIPKEKILKTNVWSSELSKLVSNAMLAQRISSINSISALCEKTGADINEVSLAVGMDKRIGSSFLQSSIGFGGSCFKKDILNLVYISRHYGLSEVADYWESVVNINNYQTKRIAEKIIQTVESNNEHNTISILGWSFKKNTNDSRESASIYLAAALLDKQINLNIYDPMVKQSRIFNDLKQILKNDNKTDNEIKNILSNVNVFNDPYESLLKTNIICICTEWDEFFQFDWTKIFNMIDAPKLIIDGRNLLDKKKLETIGFNTFFIGQ